MRSMYIVEVCMRLERGWTSDRQRSARVTQEMQLPQYVVPDRVNIYILRIISKKTI